MNDPRDFKLDVSSLPPARLARQSTPRPFLSVLFKCCAVYQRVYRSIDGSEYQGKCPRCGLPVRFAVGADGTAARSFVVE